MRYLPLLAVLFSVTSAMAKGDVSAEARYGIEALVAAKYVQKNCPTYRIDEMALLRIVTESGLTAEDVLGRHADLMGGIETEAEKHEGMTVAQFCQKLFDFYGNEGVEHHLVRQN